MVYLLYPIITLFYYLFISITAEKHISTSGDEYHTDIISICEKFVIVFNLSFTRTHVANFNQRICMRRHVSLINSLLTKLVLIPILAKSNVCKGNLQVHQDNNNHNDFI